MLTYRLIEINDGIVHYEYYPNDDRKNVGIFIFDFMNKKVLKNVEPNSPFNCLAKMVQDFIDEDGHYKKEGMVAWY